MRVCHLVSLFFIIIAVNYSFAGPKPKKLRVDDDHPDIEQQHQDLNVSVIPPKDRPVNDWLSLNKEALFLYSNAYLLKFWLLLFSIL